MLCITLNNIVSRNDMKPIFIYKISSMCAVKTIKPHIFVEMTSPKHGNLLQETILGWWKKSNSYYSRLFIASCDEIIMETDAIFKRWPRISTYDCIVISSILHLFPIHHSIQRGFIYCLSNLLGIERLLQTERLLRTCFKMDKNT